jgi:hypothetical protein
MENVWFGLHPLQEHEFVVKLANYNLIMLDENVIMVLIKRVQGCSKYVNNDEHEGPAYGMRLAFMVQ